MQKIILFLFLICFADLVYSQNTVELDRLTNRMISQEDTVLAKHLNDLSWNAIHSANYDSALIYIQQSLRISEKLNFKRGVPSCYNTFGRIFLDKGDFKTALSYYNKAFELFKELNQKEGLGTVMSGIALVYYDQGDYPNALEYNFKALKIDEEIGNKS